MSWSDLLFPGNSEKTSILAHCGKLKALLGECFIAVNHLIDRIEENFPGKKLEKIYVQTSASLGDNCIVIIERINQIDKLLKEKEFDVETRMDTKLFQDCKYLSRKFEKSIINISKNQKQLIGFVFGFIFGFVFGFIFWTVMRKMGCTLEEAILNFGIIDTLIFVLLLVAVHFVVMNMVVSAIYGLLDRKKLDHALEEYERAVEEFEPAACLFCWNICEVAELIKVHTKKVEKN